MFEVKYKLCKRTTLTRINKTIYYLAITNKEEVIDNLNLFPVNIQLVDTNSYILQFDILVEWSKVSNFNRNKTNIMLYTDLTFKEVLSMLDMFYKLRDGDFNKSFYIFCPSLFFAKEELINLIHLIIAKWEDWN
jgi:hypothetical protein